MVFSMRSFKSIFSNCLAALFEAYAGVSFSASFNDGLGALIGISTKRHSTLFNTAPVAKMVVKLQWMI